MVRISSKQAWLIGTAMIGAGAVAIAQDIAQQELWQSQSGVWTVSDGPLANGEREVVMERSPEEGSRYRYEALAGGERRISREACDGTEQRIWLVGSRTENLAAARAALLAAARPSAECSTDEAGAVTADFGTAFAAIEDRLRARPFPDIMAWRRDSDGMMGDVRTRTEGAVRIDYVVSTQGGTRVRLVVQGCGGRQRQFERQFASGSSRDRQMAAASAALRDVLAEGQRACGLDGAASARLSRGFDEAVAADFFDPDLMSDTNSVVICRERESCNGM